MKSNTLYRPTRFLLAALLAATAPLNAAMAQGYSDDMRSDSPSGMPSTSEEGSTTVTPPAQTESQMGRDDEMAQPRGARGPIRDEMEREVRPPGDIPGTPLPEYRRQLNKPFYGD